MSNLTTTPDVRDLDCLYLATIGGADYYELRQVVKEENGRRTVIGRASEWLLIEARAQRDEYAALATTSAQQAAESEIHCAELISRLSAYEEHIAALEAALNETAAAAPSLTPPEAERAEQAFVEVAQPSSPAHPCPDCGKTFATEKALGGHRGRMHGAYKQAVAPAAPDLALVEPPWRCANPDCKGAHARSLKDPRLCFACANAEVTAPLNGHLVAA